MFRRVLVPIDGSSAAKRGLEEAIQLAKDQAARIGLLHVLDESMIVRSFDAATFMPSNYIDDLTKNLADAGRKLLSRAEEQARKQGAVAETMLVEARGRRVADAIVAQAKKWKADVIVIGTHGREGLARVVLGSDAELVVRESPVPVLLVRGRVRKSK
jgi:nucleotide-binding universal stress UspA family protein